MKHYLILILCLCMLCTACSAPKQDDAPADETTAATAPTLVDSSELFTNRDLESSYDETTAARITLNGDTATSDSKGVAISEGNVTITKEGVYVITGDLANGSVIVNTAKTEKVQLVLSGASIHCETSAAIYILQADKVFLTLADGTANTLSNGGSFAAIDENNIDAVIFSKEDLTLNGSGHLTVTSPAGHGIVSKDELTCTGGSYTVQCACHGLSANDSVCITNASFHITAGKDGIQSENQEDTSLGFVHLESGSYTITAEGDGISAGSYLQILNGSYDITTGGGSVNGQKQTSDSWGGFMGGRPGGMGGRPGGGMGGGNIAQTETDSISIKGLKATSDLVIHGGSFDINSADDAIHANASVYISSGSFHISTGDDAIHADDKLTVSNGTIEISESYEGLEALNIVISGGNIALTASDDGLNAAGGTDQSGFGGHRGNDRFGGMGGMGDSAGGSILISGGQLSIHASGDGIDANGTLSITGGYTTVCGPTQGDTATLDYDISAVISGGTFIGTGASGMAQTFSDSPQGVIALSVGNQSADTPILLTDRQGNTVISYTPDLSFAVVILSSPDIVRGESYTITVGAATGTFEAN